MMEPVSMGRMSDLWKSAAEAVAPPKPLGVLAEETVVDDDWFAGTANVPFIEVGGAPAASLRVVVAPAADGSPPAMVAAPAPAVRLNDDPMPEGLFSIRFRPVVAGHLPSRGFGSEMIAYHDSDHPISEQYRLLLAEIALQLPSGPPRVLLFTGGSSQAGTTTVALNLAATIARSGSVRVTLVDLNFARPAVAERLGLSPGPGLGDVLGGRTPLPWAVQNTRLPVLRGLVAGRAPIPGNEAAFPPVIERLRAENDWVLIDAPVWSRPADAVPFADCCDAVYLVTRQPDADTAAVFEMQQGFLETTGRLKGCIITQR